MVNRTPFVREALLQEKVNDHVRCLTCERRCSISEGDSGWCRTRRNEGGTLYTLIYGAISSIAANPIEKKPFYHFHPGSYALTSGSWSCNFACPWCQNWDISRSLPERIQYMPPEKFVHETEYRHCNGTSISFNEPTLSLEWSLNVFRVAKQRGLYNTYVTNGYMTVEALDLLVESGLDAMNVDIKGNAQAVKRYCQADEEKVWRNCRRALELGVHLETTTLLIPSVNDDEETLREISSRIVGELGRHVPWHVSAYFPAYRFVAPPTPVATLEQAWIIGKESGLEYIYLGNVPGHSYENTYCPNCGTLLITRSGLSVTANRLRNTNCPQCGRKIPIVRG